MKYRVNSHADIRNLGQLFMGINPLLPLGAERNYDGIDKVPRQRNSPRTKHNYPTEDDLRNQLAENGRPYLPVC